MNNIQVNSQLVTKSTRAHHEQLIMSENQRGTVAVHCNGFFLNYRVSHDFHEVSQ